MTKFAYTVLNDWHWKFSWLNIFTDQNIHQTVDVSHSSMFVFSRSFYSVSFLGQRSDKVTVVSIYPV